MTIATLVTAALGRSVIAAGKDGLPDTKYTIAKLSDKIGTLKDGSKGQYVVLTKDGVEGVVLNLHPQHAKRLLTKGEDSGLKLVEATDVKAEPAADLTATEQAAVKAELDAEQASAPVEMSDADKERLAAAKKAMISGADDALEPAGTAAPKDEAPAPAAKAAKEPSKKDRTIAIFKSMAGQPRKDIIAKMKTDLGLSDAGANTYYQNCKSGAWA
jgi:hypothetical protein